MDGRKGNHLVERIWLGDAVRSFIVAQGEGETAHKIYISQLSAATLVIDYGRSAENPLDDSLPKQGILVAKLVGCTGTPRFRLKTSTTGLRSLGATFTVDPTTGEVRMSVDRRGGVLTIR